MKPEITGIIKYHIRAALHISTNEYCLMDIVSTLQGLPQSKYPGWCYAKNPYMAKLLGITPRGVQKIKARLEKLELLERLPNGMCRITRDAYLAIKFNILPEGVANPLADPEPRTKFVPGMNNGHSGHEQSSFNNTTDKPIYPGGELDRKINDMYDIKSLIIALVDGRNETLALRAEIKKTVANFYTAEFFAAQFEMCIGALKLHQPKEKIINAWILNGHWSNVSTFSINKITGWLNTTGKQFNTINDGGTKKGKRRKQRFQDDIK